MNIKRAKLVYSIIIAVLLVALGCSLYVIYGNLGGFDEVKVYKLPAARVTLVGKHFQTRYSDGALADQFEKCRELIESHHIKGDLVVFSYQNDSLGANEVDQFIGVSLHEEMAEIPADFDIQDFQSKERYAVFLSMHPLVRMPEKKYKALLRETAVKDGNDLQDFFVEIYYPDNSMSVEAWIK